MRKRFDLKYWRENVLVFCYETDVRFGGRIETTIDSYDVCKHVCLSIRIRGSHPAKRISEARTFVSIAPKIPRPKRD